MKNKIGKIIITIIAVIIFISLISLINNNNFSTAGTAQIIVIDESGEIVIDDQLAFKEKQNLRKLLESNYDIELVNGFLVKVENVYADGKENFIKIWVNNKAANYGVDSLYLNDGDIVHLVYTKVDDYRAPR